MALVINGDTIPSNATFTFAGQPVHKVDVCYNPNSSPQTVWMDAEPQGISTFNDNVQRTD